ncbi:unnamed protein product [Arabis nemorensis]|uniref:Uncharacterized protein n=1 Tax=Arabis nemorensis TaxID=586526 RepID=A0A565CRS7_9BRAS|nr:unnamed protein product [Arabis nemorensis]
MPGTIQVSVLGLTDVHTSSSNTSIKVAMGKLEYQTSNSGDYIFPVTRLRENLIVTLLDVNGNRILHKEIETRMIIESGFLEEKLSFNGYGNVQLKMQFVLSEEDRNRIRFLRQSALRKKHEELVSGSFFTKSKSIASDLSSLSLLKTRDIVAVANPETNLGLCQETELQTSADREPVSSNLIMWKPEVKDTAEKTKNQLSSSDVSSSKKLLEINAHREPAAPGLVILKPKVRDTVEKPENQPSSSDVSSSKQLSEVRKPESVSIVKQEDNSLIKSEKIPKRKSMRRSMSETNLSSVRKMISTFEIKVTQDTKIRTDKIQTDFKDAEEKTKAQSQPKSAVNLEKPEERKISFEDMEKSVCIDKTERCDDLVPIVSRDEKSVVIEDKSLEQNTRERSIVTEDKSLEQSTTRSDSLSKQPGQRTSVVEVRDDEKKPNKSVRLKDSQLENARGSRLWIFPDEAKDLSCKTDFGTRHLDLSQKKTEESARENIGERGFRCRSIAKMNSNNKWKNIERSKKHKAETPEDSESPRGSVGQVMRALIVVGFAGLVFLTRQRT